MEKKLYRVEENKMICGVCGGIAEYFNIDPTIIRLGVALFSLLICGAPIIAYFVAACIIPKKSEIK